METKPSFLNRFSFLLSKIEFTVSSIFLVLACLLVFISVFSRWFFGYSVSVIEEAVRYLIVWVVFIGASLTLRNDKHVIVDVLIQRLPNKIRLYLQTIAFILGLVFSIFLLIKGIELVAHSYKVGERSTSVWHFPMFIPKLALPIGALLLIFRFFEKILSNILIVIKGGV